MGRHIERFDGVHEGYGVGQINLEGWTSLELSLKKELCQIHGLRERERGR